MAPDSASRESPLGGRRIVVTRARAQAGAFSRALSALGAEVVLFPTIELLPPASYEPVDRAIRRIEEYEWLIFTSVNGVKAFWDRFQSLEGHKVALDRLRIAAIGPETASAVKALELPEAFVPETYQAESILAGLDPRELKGRRVLLPRAAKARDILPRTLEEWGASVDVVEAYRTAVPKIDAGPLRRMLRNGDIDMITFTSSSTVSHFSAFFPKEALREAVGEAAIGCIGPVTRRTAEELGLSVAVMPGEYTIPGLERAIVEYFRQKALGGRRSASGK